MSSRKKVLHATLVAGILAIGSFLLISLAMWHDRDIAIADAQRANVNRVKIAASQMEQTVRAIDFMADQVIALIPREAVTSLDALRIELSTPAFHGLLENRKDRLPDAEVITIVGADGNSIVTTRAWPAPPMNSYGGIHFTQIKDNPGPQLHISTTLPNQVTGAGTIYFSRRIDSPSGEFIGYVTVGMSPEFSESLYNNFSQIPGVFVRLIRNDGFMIAGNADSNESIVGKRIPAGNEWYRAVKAGGGAMLVTAADSKIRRLIAVQPLAKYPLAISVGIKEALVLDAWWSRAVPRALWQLAVAGIVSGLIFFIYLLYARTREARNDLARRSQDLEISYRRLNLLLSSMTHGVTMFDGEHRLLVCSKRCCDIYGLDPDMIRPGMTWESLYGLLVARGISFPGPELPSPGNPDFADHPNNPSVRICSTAAGRQIAVTRTMTRHGGWISVHEDVTEREVVARRIERLAQYDTLTGLGNRALFLKHMQTLFGKDGNRSPFALLLLDLDEFKAVNDSYGHQTGDRLLEGVADKLRASAPADMIARIGGDEFVILRELPDGEQSSVQELAEQLLQSIRRPFVIDGREIKIGLSIGATVSTSDVVSTEEILRQADLALYKAKQDGRNCFRLFRSEMEIGIQSRRELARDLDEALSAGQIQVYFQPIVEARTQDVRAMEALCRWRHPTRGFVPPSLFIPLAEEAGLIGTLGEHVLTVACGIAAKWPETVNVSVNVSAIQLWRPDYLETVKRALESSGLPASRLEMEITESVLLDDGEHNLTVPGQLHDLGISISLDDFGTGFSSLSYLDRFTFDKIKIDRSFVMRLGEGRGTSTIISAIGLIAKSYNARTVAEGVETYEQAQLLRLAGIDDFQGYLFGAPHPIESWVFENGKVSLKSEKIRSA